MPERTKYKEFTKGDTVWFIYDKDVPCVEGVLEKIVKRDADGNMALKIHWFEGGTSTIPYEHVFLTSFACREYFKNGFYKPI